MPQTLCDDFTQQNAEICANLLQMGHSVKRFRSNCANWDRKKALIRFTPRSCGRYLMYKPETVPSSKHLQKDLPNCFGIWGFPSIRLGYQSTDINIIRPGDQVIQSDLFTPWRWLRSLSLAKGSKGSLNNPEMVIKNCPGTWSNKFLPHLNSSSCSKATRTDNLLERMSYTQQGSEHISGRLGPCWDFAKFPSSKDLRLRLTKAKSLPLRRPRYLFFEILIRDIFSDRLNLSGF